ncbi:MAG: hydrogenase maturation nickel metallochaperone HypA [Ignavibacteria bacterium]|jgi:hydrogenase nickel incorporation protein HypA/HybF|nr:hydrogenase maturation nickel metallochaperone HypA [Ignavibacteria bacterium]
MHELSVAQNIVEILNENVARYEYSRVKTVLLEIGEYSGIIPDSLIFCFDSIKSDTPFENAELKIRNIPFKIYCNACKSETGNNFGMRICEKCGGNDTEIISGMELKITDVLIETL